MKTFLSIIGVAALLATGYAQDTTVITPTDTGTSTPSRVDTFIEHALQASNITAAIYGTYFNNNHAYGGGFMALYNVGQYASVGLGSDYAGQWRMFSGTVTVHYQFQLSSKLSLTLYGLAAAGTSVGGAGSDNGSLATGEGGGADIGYQFSSNWRGGFGPGYVNRQNCGDYSGSSEMLVVKVSYAF